MAEYIGNEFTYLLPGELIVTDDALKISTVLGSCVSVCLLDRERMIAGMNHYMLPINKINDVNRLRYGDTSLEDMLYQILKAGATINKLAARIYGGSSMFSNIESNFNIGKQNVAIAVQFLKKNNILIKSVETGGKTGRKVIFDTSAGLVSSNKL